jgi:outer membrane protein OmpA-like peptidoglycan-associated protein
MMTSNNQLQRTAVAGTVLLSIMMLTGCGQIARPPALTIAATATSTEPAPSVTVISDALIRHAEAALFPGDGKVTLVTPHATTTVDLTPMRGDQVEASQAKMVKKITENLAQFDRDVAAAAATSDGLDVLGVLDRALEATAPGGKVILITSGFSSVAPIDLNAGGDWIAHPDKFAKLVDKADLPNASGKSITFLGLGYPNPASAQAPAGPAVRKALTTIMINLCTRMNATSCTALPGAVGTGAPTATNTVTPVSLNQIRTHCVGEVTIDSNIMFGFGSPVLLAAADAELAPIAATLSTCPTGTTIDAIGHSSLEPGQHPGDDKLLEQQRAKAVLTRLQELGAPQGTIGQATPGGQILNNTPNGVYDESLALKNRAVTLTVSTR